MKGIYDALIARGQVIIEEKLISYIIDRFGLEFDSTVQIMSKIDFTNNKSL